MEPSIQSRRGFLNASTVKLYDFYAEDSGNSAGEEPGIFGEYLESLKLSPMTCYEIFLALD